MADLHAPSISIETITLGSTGESTSIPKPQPIPEHLWGDGWRFLEVTAEDLEHRLLISPIPIRKVAPTALPSQQDLAIDDSIPGVVIEAGKQSADLARWIAQQRPSSLEVLKRDRGALMLNTSQRQWIIPSYQDKTVQHALKNFEALKAESNGIHFLLVQPDYTGLTHTGLWILRN